MRFHVYLPLEIREEETKTHRSRTAIIQIEAESFEDVSLKIQKLIEKPIMKPNLYAFKFVIFGILSFVLLVIGQPIAGVMLFAYNLINLYHIIKQKGTEK